MVAKIILPISRCIAIKIAGEMGQIFLVAEKREHRQLVRKQHDNEIKKKLIQP